MYEYKIDFGPGYRIYFGRDGERMVILSGGGTKKRQDKASRPRSSVGPITSEERNRKFNKMALTHDFKETIRARAQRDRDFRQALLREAIESIINGDLDTGKAVLRDM